MHAPKSLSDSELILLFKNGDRKAYEEIYFRYWAVLFGHARKMLNDDEDAQDLVQDVFSIFWTKGAQVNITHSLPAYLYSMMRYKIFDYISHQKIKSEYILSLADFIEKNEYSADYRVREKQMEAIIAKEIAALPSKMREVFELSRRSHLSYREIADELGISENTVKNQINNALKILRSKLGTVIFTLFF
ncbi:RNA polymerase sigma-70 factor, ECF subfamily [Pedobacter westerhofensis]|uniref:RNA polymerase sigma-70 factor, ECF subfamily n=1 Tax=Pedobacter westerhofensis TaxID=425512 RepID=A0A521B8F9_9SPHI|nr:RNA polymerase sigma-70 factor [Pedobacter westerhofensis]SMO43357.1 RNA polymerase sigma-70 factor, ECF subfamily [Pedobacter westerhofensis]